MACTMKRSDVSTIVVDVVRAGLARPGATELSRFKEDLDNPDDNKRRSLYSPTLTGIQGAGCDLTTVSADDFADEDNDEVGDLVDLCWADVKSQQTQQPMTNLLLWNTARRISRRTARGLHELTAPSESPALSLEYLRGYRDAITDLVERFEEENKNAD